MEVKCLELRDHATFIPVICIRPVPDNAGQRYLLRRDGYTGDETERCIILIDAQCRGVAYDPYHWTADPRTKHTAHLYIEKNWHSLKDGDVIDVEYILQDQRTARLFVDGNMMFELTLTEAKALLTALRLGAARRESQALASKWGGHHKREAIIMREIYQRLVKDLHRRDDNDLRIPPSAA